MRINYLLNKSGKLPLKAFIALTLLLSVDTFTLKKELE
jgi:hypothetical protein